MALHGDGHSHQDPIKMHVSSPLIYNVGARLALGWDGTGAAHGRGSPHLTSASLLFPPSASHVLPCCRLPSREESRAPTQQAHGGQDGAGAHQRLLRGHPVQYHVAPTWGAPRAPPPTLLSS